MVDKQKVNKEVIFEQSTKNSDNYWKYNTGSKFDKYT